MNVKSKIFLVVAMLFVGSTLFPDMVLANPFDAVQIYRQARYKNYNFLKRVSQYGRAIDVQNRFGDTAYCIALRYKDKETAELLEAYGASKTNACVDEIYTEEKRNEEYLSKSKRAGVYPQRGVATPTVSSGNNYLWWGVGALAVGGGVAALASSGGGGSKNSDNNSGGSQGGGNQGGDNGGGSQGGGNQGGDNGGGSQGGGNQGSGSEGGTSEGLTNVSASFFKTSEYDKGNFLAGINAAEAYSYIYKKDENGNLVSHQAASDNALKKIKVGVIDTGVFAHHNLEGKITGSYDANLYNSLGNVRGYANGNDHYYVFEKGGKYYFLWVDVAGMSGRGAASLSKSGLLSTLSSYGLSYNDFMVLNGGGGGTPGVDFEDFDENDFNSWWNIASSLSHGTHIAGIIAGNKNEEGMHGVAFENAEIYAGSWDMSSDIRATVQDMLDNGVRVFNNSWGYNVIDGFDATNASWLYTRDSLNVLSAYAQVANNKAVWVQSTGNEGAREAALHTGIGGLDLRSYGYNGAGKYEAPFISVTALNPSTATTQAPLGQIADYANWCGSTKGYCLATPGSNILSTSAIQGNYMQMSGTSMATPVVVGSIALLNGYYPWLSAQNIAWLLLETANDEGVYADSDIYGRGVLDLEAAIVTPVGELGLASSDSFDSLEAARLSKLSLSGPLQSKLKKIMPAKIVAFDELKRPFAYDTAKFVNQTHGANANFRNEVSRMATGGVKKVVKDEKTGFSFSSSDYYGKRGTAQLANMEVVSENTAGASRFYYSEKSKYMDNDNVLTSSSNPYFAMNEAYGAEQTLNLNDTSRLKLMLQTGENGLYERDYEQDKASFDERAYALGAEYSFKLADYLELATTGGLLFEDNALLGMNGEGGFNIKEGTTYYMGLKANLNLTDKLSLLAAYYRGYTKGAETAMLSVSDLETESLNAALEYRLNAKDKVGISFGSPLSVAKGRATLRYATGRDNYSDKVYTERLSSTLKPEAREYDLGVYYQGKPKDDMSLMGKVEARFNADGEKGVTDYLGIVGVSAQF